MARIRVVAVDDSAVVRHMLRTALGGDPDLEVVGEAANGREAVERVDALRPDAVVCDVEMPVLSGIATVQELKRRHPALPVVMFASPTSEGASVTLEALHAGAADFVAKPSAAAGVAMERVLKGLVRGPGDLSAVARAAVRYAPSPTAEAAPAVAPPPQPAPAATPAAAPAAAPTASIPRPPPPPAPTTTRVAPSRPAPSRPARQAGSIAAVLIAVSTGGPNALAEVVPALPAGLPVPVLIVQHMPPVFTRQLAERLAARSRLPVREAAHGEPVEAGIVYIAPGDHHLAVRREAGAVRCALTRDPPENSVRPAADVLLRSAAAVWGGDVLVVVLTGMGQDGLAGAIALHARGAAVLAQDEASSVVWGMPGAVAKAGIADRLLPLPAIAGEIAARVAGRR
jgi:two-component system chemotaxis response regulator CheB